MSLPVVTVAVPSFNQGRFLEKALESILSQDVPVEVFVADGGSTDNSVEIIQRWQHRLAGWRSGPDQGQSAAINECIAKGTAPYVCWLNSDDWLLPGAFQALVKALKCHPEAAMAYGRTWNVDQKTGVRRPAWVRPFSQWWMARFCIVSQPGTLIRRSAWESVGGVDDKLQMAMDYDLWWRLFKRVGSLHFIDDFLAVNREHDATKTNVRRRLHYQEAMEVVRRHHGSVPFKWWLVQPYAVWYRSMLVRWF